MAGSRVLSDKFDSGDMQLLITVTCDAGVHNALRTPPGDIGHETARVAFVAQVIRRGPRRPPAAGALVSRDGNRSDPLPDHGGRAAPRKRQGVDR